MKYIKLQDTKGSNIALWLCLLLSLLAISQESNAQLSPLGQSYFQNQYLTNPAMAGLNAGLQVNVGFRQQWTSMPNAPIGQSFTAQYGALNKLGFGINVYNDKASMLKRVRAMGTVAYHVPLGANDQKLSIGISAGIMDESINTDNPEDMSDQSVTRFNDRGMYLDGDIGLAYTGNKLTVQASLPNVRKFRKEYEINNLVNAPMYFAAISYKTKINLAEDVNPLGIEPKLCYRGIDGFESIIDAGANFTFMQEKLNLVTMYHSTQNVTLGIGIKYRGLGITALHTTKAYDVKQYNMSNFELGLQYVFWNQK